MGEEMRAGWFGAGLPSVLSNQCWIGITTGPGGAEPILAGDETPLMVTEMGYKPAGCEAKLAGTVKLT